MMKNHFRQQESIPRNSRVIREECLDAETLEYVMLSAQQYRALYEEFEDHLLVCRHCLRRIRSLVAFYSILEHELRRPASPKLFELARVLAEPVE